MFMFLLIWLFKYEYTYKIHNKIISQILVHFANVKIQLYMVTTSDFCSAEKVGQSAHHGTNNDTVSDLSYTQLTSTITGHVTCENFLFSFSLRLS